MAPESVSRSERGVTDITLPNLAKIATGLGVDLPEFFSFDETPDWARAELDEDLRHVVETLRRATPEQRVRLVMAIDLIADVELQELTQRALARVLRPSRH